MRENLSMSLKLGLICMLPLLIAHYHRYMIVIIIIIICCVVAVIVMFFPYFGRCGRTVEQKASDVVAIAPKHWIFDFVVIFFSIDLVSFV